MDNMEFLTAQSSPYDHYFVKSEDSEFHPYRPEGPNPHTSINRKALPGQGFFTFKPASKRRSYMNPAAVSASLNSVGDSDLESMSCVKPEPVDLSLTWISPGMTRADKMLAAARRSRSKTQKQSHAPTPPGVHTDWHLQSMEQKGRFLGPYPIWASSSKLDAGTKVPEVEEKEGEMPWGPARGPFLQTDCESDPMDGVTVSTRRKRTVGKMMQNAHNQNGAKVMLPLTESVQGLNVLRPRMDTAALVEKYHEELQYPYTEVTAANGFVVTTEPEECKVHPRRSFFDVVLNSSIIEANRPLL